MTRRITSPTLRRLAKPVALAAVLVFVVVNALVPSSHGARPGGPATSPEVDTWFDDQMRDAGIPGAAVVVVRDGTVVDTHTFGVADDAGRPITPTTPFVIGSLTKSITALAVLQLVEAGRLSLDTPVGTVLTEYPVAGGSDSAAAASITIRDLLDQTSGLSTATGLRPFSTPVTSLEDHVEDLRDATLVSAPGASFHYSNANYLVLGQVIEEVSGESYGAYVRTHIFEPLGMADATSDAQRAAERGLTMAHRLWFGQAFTNQPLFRADMVPAGFVAASADDMGRYLLAQLGDVAVGVSPAALETMHTGVAPTGLPDQRYGFGWFDGMLGGERIVAHTGSTTDMSSMAVLVPAKHLGIVILMNGTSTLYETLHKPDTIGLAATALLLGQDPPGTLQMLYPGFIALSVGILAIITYGIIRFLRTPAATPGHGPVRSRPRRLAGLAYRGYVDVFVPLAILLVVPGYFATDWSIMARIDIGQVLLALAALRVLDGLVRGARWWSGRHVGASEFEGFPEGGAVASS